MGGDHDQSMASRVGLAHDALAGVSDPDPQAPAARAGGAEEAGRFLRIPGTNPFFPLDHGLQGNRVLSILRANPMEVYLMNTGRVGGGENDARSLKVKIRHSSAIVKGIAEGTIRWDRDPDFGYEVATAVPGLEGDDALPLRPRAGRTEGA